MTLSWSAERLKLYSDYEGRVVHVATLTPIPDAFVIAQWYGRTITGVHTYCLDFAVTKTDADGRFSFATPGVASSSRPDQLYAYKRGLTHGSFQEGLQGKALEDRLRNIHLQESRASWEDRLQDLGRYRNNYLCKSANLKLDSLRELFREIDEETKTLGIPASTHPIRFRQGMFSESLRRMEESHRR